MHAGNERKGESQRAKGDIILAGRGETEQAGEATG
jgi:hypothetical protein